MKKLTTILSSVTTIIKEKVILTVTLILFSTIGFIGLVSLTEGSILDYGYLMGIGAMTIFVLDLYITEIRPKKNSFYEKEKQKRNFNTMAVFHESNFDTENKPKNVVQLKRR